MKITRTLSPREETKIIENLCLTIQQMEHHKPNRKSAMAISLGTLLGEGNMGWNCLWPSVMPAFPFDSTEAVSLDTLLKRGGINKEDRLRLGVQIALAMMQLHTTQWLGETWGKQDIFILRRAVERDQVSGDPTLVWEPILDRPFVRRKFASLHDTQPAPVEFSIADYDKSLFSLGIILIELALGKRIEDLRDSERTNYAQTQQSHIDPDYITALSWLGHVYSAEAGDYGDAVERCINGLRLPEPMSQDLNDPRYKNEVQTQIISLLERNLRVCTYLHTACVLGLL
jgi:hypothetical protein